MHTIKAEWGKPDLPVVVGHEIVGTVSRVGPKVTEFRIGDRAGVGAQVCSCFDCSAFYFFIDVKKFLPVYL